MEIKVTIAAPEIFAAIMALADAVEAHGKPPNYQPQVEAAVTPEPKSTGLTLEQVRDKMSVLPPAKVKAMLGELGVKKLTDLPEEKYPELLQKAAAIQ